VKVYISGPMTGLPEHNRAAFDHTACMLGIQGYTPVNPFDVAAAAGIPDDSAWSTYMRADIKALMDCDAIHFLPGWNASAGAILEAKIAGALAMPVV